MADIGSRYSTKAARMLALSVNSRAIDGEFGQASRSKWSDVCGEPRCQNKVYAFEIFADEHVVSPSAT